MKFGTLLVGALASSALAAPTSNYEMHERRDFIPNSWVEEKRLDASVFLPVRIGLVQNNIDYGHELLMEM